MSSRKLKQLEQFYKTKQQKLEKITAATDNLYMDCKYGDITKAE